MKIAQTIKTVMAYLDASIVPLIVSSPGIGKSSIYYQIAENKNLKIIDLRLAGSHPTDLSGLPSFFIDSQNRKKATYAQFDTFPLVGDDLPLDENGNVMEGWLLVLDELTSAPKYIQAPCYKLILDRMVGLERLHSKVYIVAAGNLATDNAIVHKLSTALQSRMGHIHLELDKEEWVTWAIKEDIDNRILGFLEFKPSMLSNFKPDHTDNTYSCPRTLEMLSRFIKGKPLSFEESLEPIEGIVGKAFATEFLAFSQIFGTLPKISEITSNPETTEVPSETSTCFALAVYLADWINESNADAIMKYMKRVPEEFSVITLRIARVRNKSILEVPSVIEMIYSLVKLM